MSQSHNQLQSNENRVKWKMKKKNVGFETICDLIWVERSIQWHGKLGVIFIIEMNSNVVKLQSMAHSNCFNQGIISLEALLGISSPLILSLSYVLSSFHLFAMKAMQQIIWAIFFFFQIIRRESRLFIWTHTHMRTLFAKEINRVSNYVSARAVSNPKPEIQNQPTNQPILPKTDSNTLPDLLMLMLPNKKFDARQNQTWLPDQKWGIWLMLCV